MKDEIVLVKKKSRCYCDCDQCILEEYRQDESQFYEICRQCDIGYHYELKKEDNEKGGES